MFDFTVLHTETTSKSRKSLCSICLVDYINGEEVASSHWLVKPVEMKFDTDAKYRHRITEADLQDKKDLLELWGEIYPRLHGKAVIGFIANHAVSCLSETFEILRIENDKMILRDKLLNEIPLDKLKGVDVSEKKKRLADAEIQVAKIPEHRLKTRPMVVRHNRLPVFDYLCVHTLVWNIFGDVRNFISSSQLRDICAAIGHEVDIGDELSKARGVGHLFNHIANRLEVSNLYSLKQRADVTFGERVNYLESYKENGKLVEKKVLYLPCCIRRNEVNPHGKLRLLEGQYEPLTIPYTFEPEPTDEWKNGLGEVVFSTRDEHAPFIFTPNTPSLTELPYGTLHWHLTMRKGYIVIDTETTGFRPQSDRIIEICAIRFVDGVEQDRYVTLVNPRIPIPRSASRVNKITNEDVVSAPIFAEIANDLYAFLQGYPLVAHNAVRFDIPFLVHEFSRCELGFECVYVDTLYLSRLLFKLESNKLKTVLEHVGFTPGQLHRGETDCEGCAEIIKYIIKNHSQRKELVVKLIDTHTKKTQANILQAKNEGTDVAQIVFNEETGFYTVMHNHNYIGRFQKQIHSALGNAPDIVKIKIADENGANSVYVDFFK